MAGSPSAFKRDWDNVKCDGWATSGYALQNAYGRGVDSTPTEEQHRGTPSAAAAGELKGARLIRRRTITTVVAAAVLAAFAATIGAANAFASCDENGSLFWADSNAGFGS